MLLTRLFPSRATSTRDIPALQTAMAGFALDQRNPIALEYAATTTSRAWLLRSEQIEALQHLERQVQARYPQAVLRPATTDPLTLASREECSVVELMPGTTAEQPLRSWNKQELLEEGVDPLLGLLAACGDLPVRTRVVAQLVLLPAAANWSSAVRRRAVEHPLEHERRQQHLPHQQGTPGMGQVMFLLVVVLLLLLGMRFQRQLSQAIPPWGSQAIAAIMHGQAMHLTATQIGELLSAGFLLLPILGSLLFGLALLLSRFRQPAFYDQRLIAEKTTHPAYRVRLRLFLFGPGASWPIGRTDSLLQQRWSRRVARWKRLATRGRWPFLCAVWHRERARWRGGWRAFLATRRRRGVRLMLLGMLTASYRQYHLASGGYFIPHRFTARHARRLLQSRLSLFRRHAGWAADISRSRHLLSVADLAALWHLPQAQDLADLPYLEQETMRTLLAPASLATGTGYLLGISTHAGQSIPVMFPFSCLRQNLLVAASTGKGKSTLFEHLVLAWAMARVSGHPEGQGGLLLVDPHGDLAARVAGLLPDSLRDQIVFLQLSNQQYPPGFNPLDMSQGYDRDKRIANLINVVEALWPTSYGPRTENFLEYGGKTLAEANLTLVQRDPVHGPEQQFTLLDLVALFRQETFRNAVLELVSDPHLLNWWRDYYNQLDGRQQAEFTSSVVTKMSKFASSRISRRILGQPRSSLDFAELIQQQKIVLLSCAAGEVGADLAALFGSLLVGFFQTALQEQGRLPQQERQRMLVLIDEFQSLAGIHYQVLLAELRKYGGSFALASQSLAYLDRLDRTLRATVLANVDHVFAFAMADEDARLLRLPGIEPEDITQLADYCCYARLSLGGNRMPVFSLHLSAPGESNHTRLLACIQRAQERYGQPVGLVEEALASAELRQRTLKPKNKKRKGGKGYEVVWEGTGEERVDAVLTDERVHTRGRGHRTGTAQHTMYQEEADVAE